MFVPISFLLGHPVYLIYNKTNNYSQQKVWLFVFETQCTDLIVIEFYILLYLRCIQPGIPYFKLWPF